MNRDEQPSRHSDGLLMTAGKAVIVCGFKEPAETMPVSRPEHEVTGDLTRYRVGGAPVLPDIYPLGADSEHELHSGGDRPGFFEQQVGIPFGRGTSEEG